MKKLPPDPVDQEIARIEADLELLEKTAKYSNPRWLEGMKRHWLAEIARLESLRAPTKK